MDLSAVIFVLLAVAWTVYLIPRALRHHDEAARTRSIETFSESTRVLARSEPAEDLDTRLVVNTPRRPVPPSQPVPQSRPASPSRSIEPVETSRRTAARRRRRILAFLLLCVVATAVAALLAVVPWWSVAVPGGLTLAYLGLCRTQVRRSVRPVRAAGPASVPASASASASASVSAPAPAPAEPVVERVDVQVEEPSDVPFDAEAFEGAVGAPVAQLEPADARGSIWDPLPVTLPTYVTAPKAHRTVRTIDLGEPGTWTSGRTAEDAELAVQAAQPEPSDDTGRRAVGS